MFDVLRGAIEGQCVMSEADKWASLYFQHADERCPSCTPTHPACPQGARLSRLLDRAGYALARQVVGVAS